MNVQEALLDLAKLGVIASENDGELVLEGPLARIRRDVVREHKPRLVEALRHPAETAQDILDLAVSQVCGMWRERNQQADDAPHLDEELDHGLLDEASEALAIDDFNRALELIARWRSEWRRVLRICAATRTQPEEPIERTTHATSF